MAKELVITRIFDAPREMVWKAWTEPEMVMRWWGPKGYTSPVSQVDLRVGGEYFSCMRSADGQDVYSKGTYREIVPLERLVMTDSFADKDGNLVLPTHYGMPADFPAEMLVTVTFEDLGGKTKMTLAHSSPGGVDEKMSDDMNQGWNQSFDKLAELLLTQRA